MLDSFYRAFVAEQRYLLYLDGLKVTILVSVIAILIGVALGTILALMRLTAEQKGKSTLLSKIAYVYIDIIRGTPTLTQLMIMYFVILKGQNGLLVGSLTFGLNSAAYVAEIIRAGIQSVDVGQMEAARSLGIPYWKAMQKVVLPQAIRTMIPSIINQFIITLKDTSILSVIGFPELVNAAQNVIAINFKSFQVWFLVGLMYLIVITILSKIAKALERRMNRGRK